MITHVEAWGPGRPRHYADLETALGNDPGLRAGFPFCLTLKRGQETFIAVAWPNGEVREIDNISHGRLALYASEPALAAEISHAILDAACLAGIAPNIPIRWGY